MPLKITTHMVFGNLKTKGTLTEVSPPIFVDRLTLLDDRLTDDRLISPNTVYITRVKIDQGERGSINTDVFGVIPQNYVGKPVEVVKSYHQTPNGGLSIQEFYVDGKCVINSSVVMRT